MTPAHVPIGPAAFEACAGRPGLVHPGPPPHMYTVPARSTVGVLVVLLTIISSSSILKRKIESMEFCPSARSDW